MNIFITGGTSFIGAWVMQRLLEDGHHLTVLARNPDMIPLLTHHPAVTMIKGVLSDDAIINAALEGAESVVHLAHVSATGAADKVMGDLMPTVRLLEKAVTSGVGLFVFTSSTAALGQLTPEMSEYRATMPNAWWGASKAALENFVIAASHESSMRTIIIRPSLTYGGPAMEGAPSEAYDKFRAIIRQVRNNETIQLQPNDGTQMTHARDVAKVYSAVMSSNVNRRIYHAVCARRTRWEEYARLCIELTGSSSRVIDDPDAEPAFDCVYSAAGIQDDFGLVFDPLPNLKSYITFLAARNLP